MAFFFKLILLWCVLRFVTYVTSAKASPAYPLNTKKLACNKIGVIFTTGKWTTEMDGTKPPSDIIQDEFGVGIMYKIAGSATGRYLWFKFSNMFTRLLAADDTSNLQEIYWFVYYACNLQNEGAIAVLTTQPICLPVATRETWTNTNHSTGINDQTLESSWATTFPKRI